MALVGILNQNGVGSDLVLPLSNPKLDGRWYWEIHVSNAGDAPVEARETVRTGVLPHDFNLKRNTRIEREGIYWRTNAAFCYDGESILHGDPVEQNDTAIMVAFNATERFIQFGINGKWFDNALLKKVEAHGSFMTPIGAVPYVSSLHGGTGTLHIYVPTKRSDLKHLPPPGFEFLQPGQREPLPMSRIIMPRGRAQIITSFKRGITNVQQKLSKKNRTRDERRTLMRGQFEELAKEYIKKSNLHMANKLMIQIEACCPEEIEIQEKLEWLRMVNVVSQGESAKRNESLADGDKLDFVYVPTEKCGSSAHVALLSVHPEVTVPSNAETQVAFSEGREYSLIKRHRCDGIKSGLVMDARISGARQQPSGIVTGPEFAERLSQIIHPDGFFQAVRHPFGIVRSTYNSNIIRDLCGAYHFSFTNSDTPFSSQNIFDLDSHNSYAGSTKPRQLRIRLDPSDLKEHFNFAVRVPRPLSVGEYHSRYFASWNIIDLDRPNLGNQEGRLANSYRALGVDESFRHQLDEFPYRDRIHFAMLANGVNIRLFGHEFSVFIGRALQTICMNDDDLIEVMWVAPTDEAIDAGITSSICLAIRRNDWVSFSQTTKSRIVESVQLEKFFRDRLLPWWLSEYRTWSSFLSNYLISDFDLKQKQKILECSGMEIFGFMNKHPEIADSWGELTC